jgi:hypothetical protein
MLYGAVTSPESIVRGPLRVAIAQIRLLRCAVTRRSPTAIIRETFEQLHLQTN